MDESGRNPQVPRRLATESELCPTEGERRDRSAQVTDPALPGSRTGTRVPVGRAAAVHLSATLRASAIRRADGGSPPAGGGIRRAETLVLNCGWTNTDITGDNLVVSHYKRELEPPDRRHGPAGEMREGREGNLVLFVVDASGSMVARQRMRAVKGAVLSLLMDAYQLAARVLSWRYGSAAPGPLVIVHTGPGKGTSTAAFGLRCARTRR